MDRKEIWIVVALWLGTISAFLFWFDYAAATAFLHPVTDLAGNARFQVPGYPNTVYPFTYAGVAASFLGVAGFVFVRERGRMHKAGAALVAVLVANLASIGMIDLFEQVFVSLGYFTPQGHASSSFWLQQYWGTPGGAAATAGGLLVVLSVLPWSRKANWPGVALCIGLTALFLGFWFVHGFREPSNGDAVDYWMNALSRVSSQLALVAAVSTSDWGRALARQIRALARRRPPGTSLRDLDFREAPEAFPDS